MQKVMAIVFMDAQDWTYPSWVYIEMDEGQRGLHAMMAELRSIRGMGCIALVGGVLASIVLII